MRSKINKTKKQIESSIAYLKNKNRVLFITTSNRWSGEADGEVPKSNRLAEFMAKKLGGKVTILDAAKIQIYPCEGNVSTTKGNVCGVLKAKLQDPQKNPSGFHRCWASINNKDDELWKISKELFESDAIVFFTSIRWGQTNAIYQKLIERLTWIENRHSTLNEDNIVKRIEAGIIIIGQNWNGKEVLKTEKQVLKFFGFKTPSTLSWNWQFTNNPKDESNESYLEASKEFNEILE